MKLPKYVFQNPAVNGVNFSDGSHCEIINLKYSGRKHKGFAVYHSKNEKLCKTFYNYPDAKNYFDFIIEKSVAKVERIFTTNHITNI